MLFGLLALLISAGLVVLYSASGEDFQTLERQLVRIGIGVVLMLLVARLPLAWLRLAAPLIFFGGLVLLGAVTLIGEIGKGAQRWLDLGVIRFQPSEIMKLAMPMMLAAWFAWRGGAPRVLDLIVAAALLVFPAWMIFRQPDLGTALLVMASGLFVVFLAGLSWRWILGGVIALAAALPLVWSMMLDYQRRRVLTLFDPESDPLGSGYHIIQSKIAIGSGGPFGKGWLNGTQSQLEFLPERSTDFIFAVLAEEFGFMGVMVFVVLYGWIVWRGLAIALACHDRFGQLLAGSLSLTFAVYALVNMGMVSGLFPVVGVPLPLVSYGGTSLVTLLIGFGMLMAVHSSSQRPGASARRFHASTPILIAPRRS
ncbi:MAG: rod shape-determining protein RodA [Thioalkalivibrionaceae bacterium]